MENENLVSVKEAAELLGISDKTVRRKIQKGELKAELMDSPYGKQYFIPKDQINVAQNIIDVIQVKKEYSVQDLAISLAGYFQERDAKLILTMDTLRQDNEDLKNQLKFSHDQILEKLNNLETLNNKKKSRWRFWEN